MSRWEKVNHALKQLNDLREKEEISLEDYSKAFNGILESFGYNEQEFREELDKHWEDQNLN